MRWPWVVAVCAMLGVAGVTLAVGPGPDPAPVPVPPVRTTPLAIPASARVMVFAPHPDDETLGVGGLIARLVHRGVPVRVVFMTNGDGFPRALEEGLDVARPVDTDFVALGRLRQREALAALRALGVPRREVRFLGFPDGGLKELWRTHWAPGRPYTSPFTKEDSPPYADAVSPDAPYDGQALTAVVSRELRSFAPTIAVIPHPHEHHDDHTHTGYFVTEALTALADRGVIARPSVLTYLVHFPSWPAVRPPLFDRALPITEVPDTQWLETELTPAELDAKRAALAAYRSQLDVMDGFLRRFLCRNELYARVDSNLLARIASVH
jgi:LmbE family N-acetylglucosaminyl deacetylase